MLLPLLLLAIDSGPGCLVIDRAHITAGDLAQRIPAFAAMDREASFAPAPAFGARRELTSATLAKWANAPQTALEPICIFRRVVTSEEIDWEAELRQALDSLFGFHPGPHELTVVEKYLTPGAPGKLSLERSGLSFDTQTNRYLWRGKIVSEGLYAAVRIRFKLSRTERRIVTSRPLPANRLLVEDDFTWEDLAFHPELPPLETLAQAPIGQMLRRSLPKGALVLPKHLIEAPLILPGDPVELLSKSGQAEIRTQGLARGRARIGDPVLIATLEGKRLLRAVAVGPGKVEIQSAIKKNPK